eukprot:89700_1
MSPGFPIQALSVGGTIRPNQTVTRNFTVSANRFERTLNVTVILYMSPAGKLSQALESLIQEPYGCFEQTSATTYPLVMALQYFQSHSETDPDTVRTALDKLDKGYQRLIGYESPGGGFDWFGKDPGHEALTAYGILQFVDMRSVRSVDSAMIDRATQWLMDRRDGSGGFRQDPGGLDSFRGVPEDCNNAYITWALVSAGTTDLQIELNALYENATIHSSPYYVALVSAALYRGGDTARAKTLADRLVASQESDGSILGSTASIVNSRWNNLIVEATSLTILAWINDFSFFAANINSAINFLDTMRQGGRFGSTQATILALKAIVAYDYHASSTCADGIVTLSADGAPLRSFDCASRLSGEADSVVFAVEANTMRALETAGTH